MDKNVYKGRVCQLLLDERPLKFYSVAFIKESCFIKIEDGKYYDLIFDKIIPTENDDLEKGSLFLDSKTITKTAYNDFIKEDVGKIRVIRKKSVK